MSTELLYKDLSYKIRGILYEAYNYSGPGYREKYYCQIINEKLHEAKLDFVEQLEIPIQYKTKILTQRYADFAIENKIIVEIKVGKRLYQKDFDQLVEYLKITNLKLGLIALFHKNGVDISRVLNIYQ